MKKKRYFPLFEDLSDKNIVVVGGGSVATRRVKSLLIFTRRITVIAPVMTPDLQTLAMAGHIKAETRQVKRSDFAEAFMVLAATNDRKLNEAIYDICKEEGIYVNVAYNRDESDFAFPGICMQDSMVVGIVSDSDDVNRARKLRDSVQELMEQMPADFD